MENRPIITTPQNNKFVLITQKPGQYNSLSWRAETPFKKLICSGITDNPKTAEERKAFVDEVKDCVDYSLSH